MPNPSNKFKFVSPGVFITEIDNSQLPALPERIGPLVIGRAEKGPGMVPVRVESFSEYVETFGNPLPGGKNVDTWRKGNYSAPTYAGYAAQSWLRNNSPLTFIRLMGGQHTSAETAGYAGWQTANTPNTLLSSSGGAYGLFLVESDFGSSIGTQAGAVSGSAFTLLGGDGHRATGLTLREGPYAGDHATGSLIKGSQLLQQLYLPRDFGSGVGGDTLASGSRANRLRIYIPEEAGGYVGNKTVEIVVTSSTHYTVSGAAALENIGNPYQIRVSASHVTLGGGLQAQIVAAINGNHTSSVNLVYGSEVGTYGVKGLTAKLGPGARIDLTADLGGNVGNLIHVSGAGTHHHVFFASQENSGSSLSTGSVGEFYLTGGLNRNLTGALAAVFYVNKGKIELSGAHRIATSGSVQGAATLVQSHGSNKEFRTVITDYDGTAKTYTFNFDKDSEKYIRKVFNTNPAVSNPTISTTTTNYWLGSTYDRHLSEKVTSNTAGLQYGIILPLQNTNTTTYKGSKFRMGFQSARTGWYIEQNFGDPSGYNIEDQQKLFRFHTLYGGEWEQRNLKVSIQDIKVSQIGTSDYGTFTLVIRKMSDSDNAPGVLERFSNCNLNPNSPNYVARKVGDVKLVWDDAQKRYVEHGDFLNNSRYVRVEMHSDVVESKINNKSLPFGVFGPARFKTFRIASGSSVAHAPSQAHGDFRSYATASFVIGGSDFHGAKGNANNFANVGYEYTGTFAFPSLPLRVSSKSGSLPKATDAFWGVDVHRLGGGRIVEESVADLLRPVPSDFGEEANWDPSSYAQMEYQWVFSLDNICTASNGHAVYKSGSHLNIVDGTRAITAREGKDYSSVLDAEYDRFTTVLNGGFDGLDIKEAEPFRNSQWEGGTTPTETNNYAYYSIKRSIDTASDPEYLEYNLASVPGVTYSGLTDLLMNTCEDRGDAMALVDLKGGFVPETENTDALADRLGSVATTVTNLKSRQLNTSYAAAYYPWCQVRDTIDGSLVWVPPSVIAMGVLSFSERASELWFAPAGFTRGGITDGAAGIPVINVRDKLTAKNRDKLYEVNVNPIASFPSEGIVVFGQKTLQTKQSALDRINVRRLMIYVKKEISRISATTLFQQNVQQTWDQFLGRVNPFLSGIKHRLGLADYKVILDETTTTADLIDRNILYAKIFLKPAQAIEFIALDFVITDSGASFED